VCARAHLSRLALRHPFVACRNLLFNLFPLHPKRGSIFCLLFEPTALLRSALLCIPDHRHAASKQKEPISRCEFVMHGVFDTGQASNQ
jgi:hypothetical protein